MARSTGARLSRDGCAGDPQLQEHPRSPSVPASTEGLLDTLGAEIGTTPLADINYDWTEQWISALKREKHLAPGTIRKKKGALSRVLDWVARAHPLWLSANPLHYLPHGYSGYDANSRAVLAQDGIDTAGDCERNRRIGGRVFPFWDGRLDSDVLRATTSHVSALFAGVFDEAGSEDLHFHDSRHEALCRWVLEAPRPLTSEQLGRAAGMRDARTRQRYLSLEAQNSPTCSVSPEQGRGL